MCLLCGSQEMAITKFHGVYRSTRWAREEEEEERMWWDRLVSVCVRDGARARERSSVTRYQQNSSRVYCESEFNRPQANRINNINRLRWSVITQYRVKIRVPISVMGVCRRRSTHTHTQIDSLTDERKNGNKTKYSYLFLLPVVFFQSRHECHSSNRNMSRLR